MSFTKIRIGDKSGIIQYLSAYIAQSPDIFGGADIYNLRLQSVLTLAGMLPPILLGLVDGDRKQAVNKFTIIVPPGFDSEKYAEKIWSEIITNFFWLFQREITQREQEWLKKRFELIVPVDRKTHSVLDVIMIQPESTAIIVADAASYQDHCIYPYRSSLIAPSLLISEDFWVPQLHNLAIKSTNIARKNMIYVALDAYKFCPNRSKLLDLLISIEGCGIITSKYTDSPDNILASRTNQWTKWINEGRFGKILQDIESLPESFETNKPYMRIQILHKAGQVTDALKAIRQEVARGYKMDAILRLKLARIAQNANASRFASELLAPAIAELHSREDLESALATMHDADSNCLEQQVAERLEALFPDSPALQQRRLRTFLAKRDYAGASRIASTEPLGKAKFYGIIARFLSDDDTPDYRGLIDSAGNDTPLIDAYRMVCVKDALMRNLIPQAFELAMPLPETPAHAEQGERLLLEVLKNILLLPRQDEERSLVNDNFQTALISLVERLAANPNKLVIRIGIAQIVQPSIAGTMGLALLASTVLVIASRPFVFENRRTFERADAFWLLERKTFVNAVFEWLESESPIIIGKLSLPTSLLTEPADKVMSAIGDLLANLPLKSENDVVDLKKWLAFGTAVTPHCSNPDFDLTLMNLVASRFASSGYAQSARDLTEQMLLNSTTTSQRRRLGWFAMADIYHRSGNNLEALLFIACAFASHNASDENLAWQEITGLARIFRDCGLVDHARIAVQHARKILQKANISNLYISRLETLDLQIRQQTLRTGNHLNNEIENLLIDVIKNSKIILDHGDMTEPAAAILGQLLYIAEEKGVTIPEGAQEIFTELLGSNTGSTGALIRVLSVKNPSSEELFSIVTNSCLTRFSEDMGYDICNAVIVARRAISSQDFIANSTDTSFALDILADRGVATPGWDETPAPPKGLNSVEATAEIARKISQHGISIVQAGFNSFGRLVRINTVAGNMQAPLLESEDIILKERFNIWLQKYPFAYGIDDNDMNRFYRTTSNLHISDLPKGPVAIVADVSFQSFPPNLLYIEDEFAGRTRAMATVPSLAWLQVAFSKGMIGDGRLCSWISTEAGTTESQTLSMIAQRLESTFKQYKFQVDYGPNLPRTFSGASMAVITAHGGVHPEGRYFQVVSDEGLLRVSARDLADSLRNIGVVILFVCSGGRADQHPGSQTTLGLAKEVLDRGCAAVIASPWPLDARVPSHWLPVFLEHWCEGNMLVEANFNANQVVDRLFSLDPARGLAMNVFGNPLLRMY